MSMANAGAASPVHKQAQSSRCTTSWRSGGTMKRVSGSYISHLFFFSSRRRHTRFDCDWSSDVCSSDLGHTIPHDLSGHNSPEDTDESPSVGGMATIIPTKVARYPRPTPSLVQLHRARSTEDRKSVV